MKPGRCYYILKSIVNDQESYVISRHGSTHNSFRAEDDIRVTETTPLVRFPDVQQTSSWRSGTTLAFGLLLTLLLLGSVIGIYLLYLQNQSDNVLPPVDTPLLLVSHEEWCNLPTTCHLELDKVTAQPSKHIVVVQTGTAPCNDTVICSELLKSLQDKNSEPLLYNFLVSSNGVTFEGLGWETQSPMFPSLGAIVVAFIGNFTKEVPTTSQIEEAFTLFDTSNSQGHLTPDFTIVGKVTDPANVPVYLFNSLQNLTQWDHFLSDEYKI